MSQTQSKKVVRASGVKKVVRKAKESDTHSVNPENPETSFVSPETLSPETLSPETHPVDEEVATEPLQEAPTSPPVKPKRARRIQVPLKSCHVDDESVLEIGVDEAGRGPLFGRVYAAAVVLPRDFDCSKVKDSKKFTSQKKIEEAAAYIEEHALAWHVWYEDEKKIDEINILQATQLAMHCAIHKVQEKCANLPHSAFHLLIDGNYFNPIIVYDKQKQKITQIPYLTVEGGDNTYASIAAASILAKVYRDKYIDEMCTAHPELAERYSIHSNKGYGAKKHMDGLKEFGVTQWHRQSFAPCRKYSTQFV